METPNQRSFFLEHDAFQVGPWRVEPRQMHITQGEDVRRLTPKMMEVLIFLADHQGEMVTKDELMEQVWGTIHISEGAVRRTISQVRQILDDDPLSPQIIETVPKVGYRLIADVLPVAERNNNATLRHSTAAILNESAPNRQKHWFPKLLWLIPLLIILGVVAKILSTPQASVPVSTTHQVTSFYGDEIAPAISPDGQKVAFTFVNRSKEGMKADLYVTTIGSDAYLKLTDDNTFETALAWSPDGLYLAYVGLSQNEGCAIYRITVLGGLPRKLTNCNMLPDGSPPTITWSADGQSLVFPHVTAEHETPQLWVWDLADNNLTPLTSPGAGAYDVQPQFSPNASYLAFIRHTSGGNYTIQIVNNLVSPEPVEVYSSQRPIWNIYWRDEGDALYFVADSEPGRPQLMSISRSGSIIRRVSLPDGIQIGLHTSIAGNRLVYNEMDIETDLWQLDLGNGAQSKLPISSTRNDLLPSLDPTGNQIAFFSDRNGQISLWVGNTTTGTAQMLSPVTGSDFTKPSWDATGDFIYVGSGDGISRVNVATGQREILGTANPTALYVSRDNSLYFSKESEDSDSSSTYIWHTPFQEQPKPVSSDLRLKGIANDMLIGTTPGQDSLLTQLTFQGNHANNIATDFAITNTSPADWIILPTGFYYVAWDKALELRFFDFESGKSEKKAIFPEGQIRSLSLSPDQKTIVFDLDVLNGIDILMLEEFDQVY